MATLKFGEIQQLAFVARDSVITVRGKIDEVGRLGFDMVECELVLVKPPSSKPPRGDALRRAGLMVENCTYGQPYDQYVESTGSG